MSTPVEEPSGIAPRESHILGLILQLMAGDPNGAHVARDAFCPWSGTLVAGEPIIVRLPEYDTYSSIFLDGDVESLGSVSLIGSGDNAQRKVLRVGDSVPIRAHKGSPPFHTDLVLWPDSQLGRPMRPISIHIGANFVEQQMGPPPEGAPGVAADEVTEMLESKTNKLELPNYPNCICSIVIHSAAPVSEAIVRANKVIVRRLASDASHRHVFGISKRATGFHIPFDNGAEPTPSFLAAQWINNLSIEWTTEDGADRGGTVEIVGRPIT